MIEVKDIMQEAIGLGACSQSAKATDWKSIAWLFFSPQGREFCRDHNFPNMETFRAMAPYVGKYGMYVEKSVNETNKDVGLIGDCFGILHYSGTDRAYKVILMHGAKARINLRNYAVVRLENISGSYEIINEDGTGEVLV